MATSKKVPHPNQIHVVRRIKNRGPKPPLPPVVTQSNGQSKSPRWGFLLLVAALATAFAAVYVSKLDEKTTPPPSKTPETTRPLVQPKQPLAVECSSGLYEGVCVDHVGTGITVLTTGIQHLQVRTGGTREFYELTANKSYEQLVLVRPLFDYWSRKLEDPSLFAGERVFIQSGERSLRAVLEDVHEALGVSLVESQGVRNGTLPSGVGGIGRIRFSIQGMDATFSRVVTAAMYLYCEHGDGKGMCTSPINPSGLAFKNYDADGWVIEGSVVRNLGITPYTKIHLSQDFVGRDGCAERKRNAFKALFRQSPPSFGDPHQHAGHIENVVRQWACGASDQQPMVGVKQGSPLAQVL